MRTVTPEAKVFLIGFVCGIVACGGFIIDSVFR